MVARMKFRIKNLGPLKDAEIEPGKLTIFTGTNNTGKTYAMNILWALYNMPLLYETKYSELKFIKKFADELKEKKEVSINLEEIFRDHANEFDHFFSNRIKNSFPQLFNFNNFILKKISFSVTDYIGDGYNRDKISVIDDINANPYFSMNINNSVANFKVKDKDLIFAYLYENPSEIFENEEIDKEAPYETVISNLDYREIIGDGLMKVISEYLLEYQHVYGKRRRRLGFFRDVFDSSFFIPASRSGLNLTYYDLRHISAKRDRERTRLVQPKAAEKSVTKITAQYTQPVELYLDLLELGSRVGSSFTKNIYTEFLQDKITKVDYAIDESGMVTAQPKDSELALPLHMMSSTSAGLFGLWLWLNIRTMLQVQSILIDEPELNLHPDNQRLLARLLVKLVNDGAHIAISTHSDYIVREINSMMMLYHDFPGRSDIEAGNGFDPNGSERMNPAEVRAYHFTDDGVEPCPIEFPGGIKVKSMNQAIKSQNNCFNAIYDASDIGDNN